MSMWLRKEIQALLHEQKLIKVILAHPLVDVLFNSPNIAYLSEITEYTHILDIMVLDVALGR